MTFDAMIDAGWAKHDRDPKGVAERLESGVGLVRDASQAGKYAHLANHVLGEALGDWPAAVRLTASAILRVARSQELIPAFCSLAVARFMAGDPAGSLAAESAAIALDPTSAPATCVRARMLVAQAVAGAGRWEECRRLYFAALELADTLGEPGSADRSVAVASNNIASAILELAARTQELDDLMERAAQAARTYWLRAGDWRNDERADYLLALVSNALGRHEEALAFASRGLATIRAGGEENVDQAFLHVARARAHRGLGETGEAAREIEAAEALGRGFGDAGLERRLADEIAKVRGA